MYPDVTSSILSISFKLSAKNIARQNQLTRTTSSVCELSLNSKMSDPSSQTPTRTGPRADHEPKDLRRSARTTLPSYMHLKIQFEGAISGRTLCNVIDNATQSLYGIVGGAMLYYEMLPHPGPDQALLQVPIKHHRRLWAALTMLSSVGKKPVRITVLKATPFSSALFDDQPSG